MARIDWHDDAIEEMLTGPTGPVSRLMLEFADEVVIRAKQNAPSGPDSHGVLREGIEIQETHVVPGKSITHKVGTDPIDPDNGFGYGLVAHEGHGVLRAKGPFGMNFFWFARNTEVEGARLIEPTDGTPFLTDALREVNFATGEKFLLEPGDQGGRIG